MAVLSEVKHRSIWMKSVSLQPQGHFNQEIGALKWVKRSKRGEHGGACPRRDWKHTQLFDSKSQRIIRNGFVQKCGYTHKWPFE